MLYGVTPQNLVFNFAFERNGRSLTLFLALSLAISIFLLNTSFFIY